MIVPHPSHATIPEREAGDAISVRDSSDARAEGATVPSAPCATLRTDQIRSWSESIEALGPVYRRQVRRAAEDVWLRFVDDVLHHRIPHPSRAPKRCLYRLRDLAEAAAGRLPYFSGQHQAAFLALALSPSASQALVNISAIGVLWPEAKQPLRLAAHGQRVEDADVTVIVKPERFAQLVVRNDILLALMSVPTQDHGVEIRATDAEAVEEMPIVLRVIP
ncbi:MAG: hypothetical protein K2R93_21450 [Gemmatimonadaceae bacterium]|nr:hypothetical protein [Gemmatimonadaceae bacterium]